MIFDQFEGILDNIIAAKIFENGFYKKQLLFKNNFKWRNIVWIQNNFFIEIFQFHLSSAQLIVQSPPGDSRFK